MGDIQAALDALKSLKLGETPNYTTIAKQYGVDRSTLSQRHRGVTRSLEEQASNAQNLNPTQEQQLVKYIDSLCKRGLPPTRGIIQNFALEIARKLISKC